MATRTVVCPECESPLSPGRFSCSACGALVASVATVARAFTEPDVLNSVEPEAEAEVARAPRSVDTLIAADDGWDEVRDELDTSPVNGRSADEVADDRPLASAMTPDPEAPPVGDADPSDAMDHGAADAPDAPEAVAAASDPAATDAPEPVATEAAEPAWPDHPAWPLPTVDPRTPPSVLGLVGGPEAEPDSADVDDAFATAVATTPGDVSSTRVPAGVYLPPSAVLPPGEALPLPGAGAAAASAPGTTAVEAGQPVAPRSTRGPLSGLADSLNSLAVPADAGSRTIAIGGGIAGLGFLLPWADIVIGSRSLDGGLFSTWGLAGPAAPFVLLLVVGLTALAVLRTNLPAWIGLSTPAIALAALLIGILWPYLFGSFGPAIGVYVVAAGAFVLVAGGLVERVASRHDEPTTGV